MLAWCRNGWAGRQSPFLSPWAAFPRPHPAPAHFFGNLGHYFTRNKWWALPLVPSTTFCPPGPHSCRVAACPPVSLLYPEASSSQSCLALCRGCPWPWASPGTAGQLTGWGSGPGRWAGGQVRAPRGPWVGGPQAGSPPGVSPLLRAWPQSTGAKPWRGGDSFPRMLGAGPALPASSQSWRPPISPRAAGQPHFDAPAPLAGSCGALDGSPSAPLDPAPAASRTHLQPLPPNPRQPRRPPSAGPGEPHCGAQRGEVGPTEASALTRAHPDQREREGTEG